jgi:hypothetical protein
MSHRAAGVRCCDGRARTPPHLTEWRRARDGPWPVWRRPGAGRWRIRSSVTTSGCGTAMLGSSRTWTRPDG